MPDYKRLTRRKKSSRKKAQVHPRPKKFLRPIGLLLILGGLILGGYFGVGYLLLHFSAFKISEVAIVDTDGKKLKDPEGIFRLDQDLDLLSFNMKRVAQDIQARHPEFLAVHLRKQFPNRLMITVRQRKPLAIVGIQKRCLTDEQSFILPYESSYRHLPTIVGIHPRQIQLYEQTPSLKLKRVLNLLKELKAVKIYPQYKITQIDIRQYSNIIFYLENKIEVKMGEGGFGRKAALLKVILTQLKERDTTPKYIDMRFDNPAVMP